MTTYDWLGVLAVVNCLMFLLAPIAVVVGLMLLGFDVVLSFKSYVGAGILLSAVWMGKL